MARALVARRGRRQHRRVDFGNGAPWSSFTQPPLDLAAIERLGRWFLVLRPRPPPGAPVPVPPRVADDPTDGVDTSSLPRSPTGSLVGVAASEQSPRVVFRVRRLPSSRFDFISVGRNENNDIHLPDGSVSRFHAYLKESDDGQLALLDAKSNNGTFARGERVPRQGEGPAVVLHAGDAVRFGDVHGVVVDAASLLRLVQGGLSG